MGHCPSPNKRPWIYLFLKGGGGGGRGGGRGGIIAGIEE